MDDDNWLEAEVIACPSCGLRLYSVLHSPMFDDFRLYCDRCPRAVEVRNPLGRRRCHTDRTVRIGRDGSAQLAPYSVHAAFRLRWSMSTPAVGLARWRRRQNAKFY